MTSSISRLPRLLRALQTVGLAAVRAVTAPAWTRDFAAYIYLYRPTPYEPHIKAVALVDLLPGIESESVTLRKCFPQHGNMTAEEICAVCLLVRWARPKIIFEFGTFNGNTTLQIAINASKDCRIFTLNLPPEHGDTQLVSSAQDRMVHTRLVGSGQAFHEEPERIKIHELFGDSANFDFTPYAAQCELVLVDAGHEYDYVKSDTSNALRLLAPGGGVILWHDFPNAPGVCAWLEEFGRGQTVYHIRGTRLAFTIIGSLRQFRK